MAQPQAQKNQGEGSPGISTLGSIFFCLSSKLPHFPSSPTALSLQGPHVAQTSWCLPLLSL